MFALKKQDKGMQQHPHNIYTLMMPTRVRTFSPPSHKILNFFFNFQHAVKQQWMRVLEENSVWFIRGIQACKRNLMAPYMRGKRRVETLFLDVLPAFYPQAELTGTGMLFARGSLGYYSCIVNDSVNNREQYTSNPRVMAREHFYTGH